jgi:hypothetical protein
MRTADADPAAAGWINALTAGTASLADVAVALLSSSEYLSRAVRGY